MSKISLTLTSGNKVEKPLVTAFRGSTGEYVVLDNELNGTMGLPIILVSKYADNKLNKIEDQNEWGSVKEILRNIIAGNQVDYISIPEALNADDLFYSQLTLPVASFEALKNNYNGGQAKENPEMPIPTEMPNINGGAAPVQMPAPDQAPAPVQAIAPEPAPSPMPNVSSVGPMPDVEPVMPTMPIPPEVPTAPQVVSAPAAPDIPASPVMPASPVTPSPVVEPIPESPQIDFSQDKEAFLKACENMFDALVAKFNNK